MLRNDHGRISAYVAATRTVVWIRQIWRSVLLATFKFMKKDTRKFKKFLLIPPNITMTPFIIKKIITLKSHKKNVLTNLKILSWPLFILIIFKISHKNHHKKLQTNIITINIFITINQMNKHKVKYISNACIPKLLQKIFTFFLYCI